MARNPNSRRRISVISIALVSGATIAAAGMTAASSGDRSLAAASPGPSLAPGDTPTATPDPTPPAEPPLGQIPVITQRGQHVPMPLDPYMTSMNDLKTIDGAVAISASDCMQSLGYTDWTATTITTFQPGDYVEFDPLDYIDPATVAKAGYPVAPNKKGGTGESAADSSTPTEEEIAAFTGTGDTADAAPKAGATVPPGGCDGQGERQIYGDVQDLPADPRGLRLEAQDSAQADSRMQQAFATWSTCMRAAGLSYDDPMDAQADSRWADRDSAAPPSTEEKQTAAADATCQQKINLAGTYTALQIAYQNRLVTANKTQLDQSTQIFHNQWLANARVLLAKERH
jgi:hypothetical protein